MARNAAAISSEGLVVLALFEEVAASARREFGTHPSVGRLGLAITLLPAALRAAGSARARFSPRSNMVRTGLSSAS
jgi:hypothetical protein